MSNETGVRPEVAQWVQGITTYAQCAPDTGVGFVAALVVQAIGKRAGDVGDDNALYYAACEAYDAFVKSGLFGEKVQSGLVDSLRVVELVCRFANGEAV